MPDLHALLHDEHPTPTDDVFTLLAAEVDDPLGYLFESNSWIEVCGAAKQLASFSERFDAALAAEGCHDVLYMDAGGLIAFVDFSDNAAKAERLEKAIERIAPQATGVVTISTLRQTLTVRQALEGLYRAPTQVLGIPGVNSYQARVNRYYGLGSPSTVPTSAQIAARRHFGEVLALIDQGLQRVRESRLSVPFYEYLPFAERCAACRMRPAECLIDTVPLCGICQRKRLAAPTAVDYSAYAALLLIRVPGLSKWLQTQRTPAAFRRSAALIRQAFERASERSGALWLWGAGDSVLMASAASDVLERAARFMSTFLDLSRDTPLSLSVGLAAGCEGPQHLYRLVRSALAEALHSEDPNRVTLRFLDSGDLQAPPYTSEMLGRLHGAFSRFQTARFPPDAFPDLSAQIARGTASLYYGYGCTRLDESRRRLLDQLEDEWGRDTLRFYHALNDLMNLQKVAHDHA